MVDWGLEWAKRRKEWEEKKLELLKARVELLEFETAVYKEDMETADRIWKDKKDPDKKEEPKYKYVDTAKEVMYV